jgi:hypothetical protein
LPLLRATQASGCRIDGKHLMPELTQRRNDLRGARNLDIAFFAGSAEKHGDFHVAASVSTEAKK